MNKRKEKFIDQNDDKREFFFFDFFQFFSAHPFFILLIDWLYPQKKQPIPMQFIKIQTGMILEHYIFEKELGRGNFGVVYKGVDT